MAVKHPLQAGSGFADDAQAPDRSRAVLDAVLSFAIVATDTTGRITEWSAGAERLLGWSAGQMHGETLERLFSAADRAAGCPQSQLRLALDAGRADDEGWVPCRDGSLLRAAGETTPLRDAYGTHRGFVRVLRDRTAAHRAAEALAGAHALDGLILDAVADGIVVLDADDRIGFAAAAARAAQPPAAAGASAAAKVRLPGLPWGELWVGESLEPSLAALRAARAGGTGRFQGSSRMLAGPARWWDVTLSLLPGGRAGAGRVLAIGRDITATRQDAIRQAALQALGERLRDLRDPDAMAQAAADVMGRALDTGRAGYGTVDPVRETITIQRDWAAPGTRHLAGTTLRFRDFGSYIEDLGRGEVVVLHDAAADPRTAGGGEALTAIDTRAFLNLPVFEDGGFVALFFVTQPQPRRWSNAEIDFVRTLADRTFAAIGRSRAEAELRALAASLERQVAERTADRDRLWQLSTDLMLVARLDGTIVAVNPAWTAALGWAMHETLGRSVFDFMHPDDRDPGARAVGDIARGETVSRHDNRCRHRDGRYRWITWTAVPGDGLVNAVGRDITGEREQAVALREAEDALRQAQKMEAVGQLTGGLAHDFNNLLAGITGSLELMQTRLAQGRVGELDRYIAAAQGAATRAAALTHRLLAFSRRQTLDSRPLDVNRLVSGMEDLVRRTVGPAIEVATEPAAGLWTTLADPNQLENALLNLCINARDAMPDGGRIVIATANVAAGEQAGGVQAGGVQAGGVQAGGVQAGGVQVGGVEAGGEWGGEHAARGLSAGDHVRLSVADTGLGMAPEVARRAFDPFFTTKPSGQGTGLGLSMIYGFAQQSGGEVQLASAPGQGTTVRLLLPRHHAAVDAPAAAPVVDAPRAGRGESVLVVDDEPTVRMLVGEVLEELGYTAIEAADGAAGLVAVHSPRRIDLLVTDVGLPGGLDGRQLAEAARAVRPGLKVLFITGYAESAALGASACEPWMHVLTKPFAMEALASCIRELITGG